MERPLIRKPWTHGAKAYHEADSLGDIVNGLGRLRRPLTVLIHHSGHGLDGVPCASCGGDLAGPYGDDDRVDSYSMVDVNPRTKQTVARHYYCAWGMTMNEVVRLSRLVQV